MRTLAIMNQKGGTGKTTTAVNLAAALAELGRRVLLVDLDPQANASSWLGVNPDAHGGLDTYALLCGGRSLADVIQQSTVEGLDVAPASSMLAAVPTDTPPRALRDSMARTVARYDHILIDCPPGLGPCSIAGLTAAEGVLIPVELQVISLAGLVQLIQTIERIQASGQNKGLEIAGILPCRVSRSKHSQEVRERLRKHFAGLLFKASIRQTVKIAEAYSHGKPITEYDRTGPAANDYRTAAAELIKKGGTHGKA